jgi:hypothetical protein
MVSSAPSRAGVEGWPGVAKNNRSGLRTSPVSWLGGSSVPACRYIIGGRCEAFPWRCPLFLEAIFLERIASSERCAAVAAAVPYSALQSRGGDGLFHVHPRRWPGERTVFPCTKSAVIVWGASCGGPLGVIHVPQQFAAAFG